MSKSQTTGSLLC